MHFRTEAACLTDLFALRSNRISSSSTSGISRAKPIASGPSLSSGVRLWRSPLRRRQIDGLRCALPILLSLVLPPYLELSSSKKSFCFFYFRERSARFTSPASVGDSLTAMLIEESRQRFEIGFGFFPEGEVGAVLEDLDPAVG